MADFNLYGFKQSGQMVEFEGRRDVTTNKFYFVRKRTMLVYEKRVNHQHNSSLWSYGLLFRPWWVKARNL